MQALGNCLHLTKCYSSASDGKGKTTMENMSFGNLTFKAPCIPKTS